MGATQVRERPELKQVTMLDYGVTTVIWRNVVKFRGRKKTRNVVMVLLGGKILECSNSGVCSQIDCCDGMMVEY